MNIKEIINSEKIIAKKKYGQNFLVDQNVLKNIIAKANIENSNIIEIGPGIGSLTEHLVKKAKKIVCYEIDKDMVDILNKNFDNENLYILHKDFLKCDLDEDIKNYFSNEDVIVVSNLPYYITTAILTKIIEETKKIKRIVVMVQKEVAERFCGKPSTKDYNGLSVLIQYYTNTKILFDVSPKCFIPEPDVTSSVIMIERRDELMHVKDEKFFLKFNKWIFSMRRKTLYNNIKKYINISKEEIEQVYCKNNLDINVRAENLTVEQIVKLANDLTH